MHAKSNLHAANGAGLTPLAVALSNYSTCNYSTCNTARLKLVERASPDVCKFKTSLSARKTPRVLPNVQAIGPLSHALSPAGMFDKIKLGTGAVVVDFIEVHLNDHGFIIWNCRYGEMVCDVDDSNLPAGTHLQVIKTAVSRNTINGKDTKRRKTKACT